VQAKVIILYVPHQTVSNVQLKFRGNNNNSNNNCVGFCPSSVITEFRFSARCVVVT
jgi:hypothetical protein